LALRGDTPLPGDDSGIGADQATEIGAGFYSELDLRVTGQGCYGS